MIWLFVFTVLVLNAALYQFLEQERRHKLEKLRMERRHRRELEDLASFLVVLPRRGPKATGAAPQVPVAPRGDKLMM